MRWALALMTVRSSPPARKSRPPSWLGLARTRVGEQLDLIDQDAFKFCWIIDFPFYEWDEDNKKVDFAHNPFSMPQGGLEALKRRIR
jgi:aspartyl-tRNA synthetase